MSKIIERAPFPWWFVLVVAAIASSVLGLVLPGVLKMNNKSEACRNADGVYLVREQLCLKREAVLKPAEGPK